MEGFPLLVILSFIGGCATGGVVTRGFSSPWETHAYYTCFALDYGFAPERGSAQDEKFWEAVHHVTTVYSIDVSVVPVPVSGRSQKALHNNRQTIGCSAVGFRTRLVSTHVSCNSAW